MLRVLGSPRKLCDGVTRREMLQVGGLGMCGLGLNTLMQAQAAQAATRTGDAVGSFGRAKR
jgi:hypothetical protein